MTTTRCLVLLLAVLGVACGAKKGDPPHARKERGPLPPVPMQLDLGQEPIVNPVNLWEMMIEGSPDHETVGFVGTHEITTGQLDKASDALLTRIGDRIYLARDRGWRAMLESEGLARAAVAAGKSIDQLLADEYAALPVPPEVAIERLLDDDGLANVDDASKRAAAVSLWRLRQWVILRSVIIDEGLREVPRERAQLMLLNPEFAPPTTSIGKIGDRVVTRAELHLAAGYAEQTARREYFDAARMVFNAEVRTRLLADAAAAENSTVDALMARESSKLGPVTRAAVAAFVAEHPEYQPHPERARDAVRTLREAEAKEALLTRLADAAGGIRFVLKEPPFDRISPSVMQPRLAGTASATNTIEILHCVGGPTCARGGSLLRAILERYGDRARIVLGDYFSGMDAARLRHAIALRCAEDQRRGWPLLARLLEVPTRGGTSELAEAASAAGLEPSAFAACLAADRHLEVVVENTLRAEQLGLEMNILGIWVNGVRLDQLGDAEHVRRSIDQHLN
jgi:hypothetical protein